MLNTKIKILDEKIKKSLEESEPNCNIFTNIDTGYGYEMEVDRRCGKEINYDRGVMKKFLFIMWQSLKFSEETYNTVYSSLNFNDFMEIKNNKIDYKYIIQNCRHNTNCYKKPKYNLIIPVKNREDHLKTFLKNTISLFKSNPDWCLTIIFQEDDDQNFKKTLSILAEGSNVHIIDMPHNDEFILQYGNNMNRSLCYNVASMFVECEFQINHDVDLLFGQNYIDNVERKTKNQSFMWLQPYRGSRVIPLTDTQTEYFKNEIENGNSLPIHIIKIPPTRNTPNAVGSTGGSIVVKYEVFKEIGGYDPEIVWGYAPEDIIFWLKLEIYFKTYKYTEQYKSEPFCSNDVFSHDTDVELFHMYHPLTETDKRYPYFPLYISNWLMNIATEEEHTKWLEVSREKFYNNDAGI